MRVLSDVAIERIEQEQLVVLSQAPAVIGEEMALDLFSGKERIALRVRVLDSRPVVVGGSMRHRLRVMVLSLVPLDALSNGESLGDSPTRPEVA